MITIKNKQVLSELLMVPYDTHLIDIMMWFLSYYSAQTITSGYRPEDKTSVHSTIPCRGIDIRSSIYPDPQAIADHINAIWSYDDRRPGKPVCIYHDHHLHIQTSYRTIRRDNA
jgi:hypothetical protein